MNYEVTAPDGRKFVVTAPEGATQDEVMSFAKGQWDRRAKREAIEAKIANDTISTGARDFAKDMPLGDQVLAGAGSAVQNVADAGRQLVGKGPNAEQVLERRRLDAPLMNTAGGLSGNVAGNLSMLAPASLLPGGATVPGAAAMGAIMGGFQPTVNAQERLQNMVIGGALGGGGQWLGTTGATMLGQRAAANQAASQAAQMQNSVRDQTLRDAQAAGAKVPVSAVNPSMANNALESIGGKAAIAQDLSHQNQRVWDDLSRQAGGLSPNQPITAANLRTARQEMAQPYREIAAIDKYAQADLEALQAARHDSKLYWKSYGRNADPAAYTAATKADARVNFLQDMLEDHALQAGKPELVQAMKEARSRLAQNHQVQSSLNRGTGSVDASVIGRALDNGAPLSGPLATIGRFQQAFPQYAREAAGVPPPGVSKVGALASGGFGLGGIAAGGLPGAGLAAVPFVAPPMARALATSGPYQRLMAQPSYSAGPLAGAASRGLLPAPEMMGLLGRTAIPAIYAGAMQ